jgi:hypothetical protein
MIGQPGDGPGEFRSITYMVVSPGDTLYVYERLNRTVYAPDHSMIRRDRVAAFGVVMAGLPDGRHVLGARVNDAAGTPNALHILARDGAIVRSMAPYTGLQLTSPSIVLRGIQVDAAGRIWSARYSSYGVDVFDTTGTKKQEYVINSRWWNDAGHPESQFRAAVPSPGDSSVVWLRSVFRDTSYKAPPRLPGDISAAPPGQAELRFDTRLEAMDRRTGTILASARFPHATPISAFGLFFPVLIVSNDGSVAVEILEPVLVRR